MNNKYEILEHKADLKIRGFGRSKEELFLNMMVGMAECMQPEIQKAGKKVTRQFTIQSLDFPTLLVDFLNEVLYLSQTNKETYTDVRFNKLTEAELECEISGQKVKRFNEDIKAVTYHDLEIKNVDNNWTAIVLFDI
jgi:SHS2 domain-containing protein